jgi:kynurenine formamidase
MLKNRENIVRLGMPINNGTNLYPMVKDESTEICPITTVHKDGFEVCNVSVTMLDCTYVETVRHISSEGPLPMEVFADRSAYDLYRAIVVHLDVEESAEISLSDLESQLSMLEKGDALIVDANGYTDKYLQQNNGVINVHSYNLNSPYFSNEAMQGIIDAGAAILAGNFPSYSKPNAEEGFGIDMIAEFYKTTTNMILAPLVNLGKIEESEVVLQINAVEIEGCCGLLCSPVAYQGELRKHFLDYLRFIRD